MTNKIGSAIGENKLRSTWANINKGLVLILIGIPLSLFMFSLYYEPPQELMKCTEHRGSQTSDCSYYAEKDMMDFYWPFLRLEITFLLILVISFGCYDWRYGILFGV